jgi:hypothetical protein
MEASLGEPEFSSDSDFCDLGIRRSGIRIGSGIPDASAANYNCGASFANARIDDTSANFASSAASRLKCRST